MPSRISFSQTSACFSSGQQDHHDVAGARGVGHVEDPHAVPLGIRAARRVRPQPDDDLDTRILQVQRVGVTLGAVAEHGHGLALEQPEVGVALVEDVRHQIAQATGACRAEAFPGGFAGVPA